MILQEPDPTNHSTNLFSALNRLAVPDFSRNLYSHFNHATMKKSIFFLLICSAVILACNSSGGSSAKSDSAAAPAPAAAADSKGLELIGSSDCTTCHRLHKEAAGASIGPSYSE